MVFIFLPTILNVAHADKCTVVFSSLPKGLDDAQFVKYLKSKGFPNFNFRDDYPHRYLTICVCVRFAVYSLRSPYPSYHVENLNEYKVFVGIDTRTWSHTDILSAKRSQPWERQHPSFYVASMTRVCSHLVILVIFASSFSKLLLAQSFTAVSVSEHARKISS